MSATETSEIQGPDSPRTTPGIAPMLPEAPEASKEPGIPKPRQNSLSGLPQYDPAEYGHGKSRRTATKTRRGSLHILELQWCVPNVVQNAYIV